MSDKQTLIKMADETVLRFQALEDGTFHGATWKGTKRIRGFDLTALQYENGIASALKLGVEITANEWLKLRNEMGL
jgi:hypothetical protein